MVLGHAVTDRPTSATHLKIDMAMKVTHNSNMIVSPALAFTLQINHQCPAEQCGGCVGSVPRRGVGQGVVGTDLDGDDLAEGNTSREESSGNSREAHLGLDLKCKWKEGARASYV